MSKVNKKAVNWTIDKKIVKHIEDKAKEEGRSISGMTNFILSTALFNKKP